MSSMCAFLFNPSSLQRLRRTRSCRSIKQEKDNRITAHSEEIAAANVDGITNNHHCGLSFLRKSNIIDEFLVFEDSKLKL
jgi:hypothetical protein